MKKTILVLGVSILLALITITATQVLAEDKRQLVLRCSDTEAGNDANIKAFSYDNVNISLTLKNPSEKLIVLNEKTNSQGEIALQIPGYHLTQAGLYNLSAADEENEVSTCNFNVLTGKLSKDKSSISVDKKTAVSDDLDGMMTTVTLVDDYMNPISGHEIELFSSRKSDDIQLISQAPYTNESGKIKFLVHSDTEGLTTLSAFDSTENEMLESRTDIAFLQKVNTAMGGQILASTKNAYNEIDPRIYLSSLDNSGQIDHFLVETNDKITKNESSSVTVSAVDELSNVVPNYTGTIRFSSTDSNAILPEDYTFTANDLGVHEFSLGVTFKTEGNQILNINDTDSDSIRGEKEISISPGVEILQDKQKLSISISSPNTGSYSNKTVKLIGTTQPDTKLVLTDADTEVGNFMSNAKGDFAYTISNLQDGLHAFKLKDSTGLAESEPLEITIDTTPPQIVELKVEPDGPYAPKSEITIKLVSEENLSQSDILIGNATVQLKETGEGAGLYSSTYILDTIPGKYPLDIVLKDALGNETSVPKHMELEVKNPKPSKVTEVSSRAEDGKITLSWASAEDDTYITKYKIHYGTNASELVSEVITYDSATTWYIPNLKNDQNYFFTVSAIDSDNNEGDVSEIVSATPKAPLNASLGDPIILKELPTKTPETGPEIWYILLTSLFIIDIYLRHKKTN